ncbi:MAG: hypothetical protein NC124_02360 [Clostridium sp.]|nr:hypothetical protein [Clostridium sp.]
MKNTTIATREFNIDGFRFLPGDEVDVIALGKDNVIFRTLVHSRHIAYGAYGREFSEVAEANGYEYDKETGKAAKKVAVEEVEEIVEAKVETVTEVVEEPEIRSRNKRRG